MMDAQIRAKAKDAVDELDNLTAYLTVEERKLIAGFVMDTLHSVAKMSADEVNLFAKKFEAYWSAPEA